MPPVSTRFDITAFCTRMTELVGCQEGPARVFWRALSFSVDAHQGQTRKSGEAFVSHPCSVALILAEEMGINDPETLAAAMLHDTVEDVDTVTSEEIGELFGRNIEQLVDGCTKISHFEGDRHTFLQLVHRKIFSGAASQVGVILIKLADRLHNLRTMGAMPQHKRQKIADETLAVYAPLAKVMGLYSLKRELYSLALANKFPRQSPKVFARIRQVTEAESAQSIREHLDAAFREAWVTAEVRVRARGLSAYFDQENKVLRERIEDSAQIIIVVPDIQSCYRALGIVNQAYPPIPRTIRDYIANPKPTGYQSLHVRANVRGETYLFKIRTATMLQSARTGIIREWLTGGRVADWFEKEIREMFNILGSMDGLQYQEVIARSTEKEIYTYTPKGDRIVLPRESIVLDFAFKVHTEIGSRCTGAVVGEKRVDSGYRLQEGDCVRVVCADRSVRFDPAIVERCQTPRARSEITRLLRMRIVNMARQVGESLVQQELARYGIPREILGQEGMEDILIYFGVESRDDLYIMVGLGRLRLREIIYEIRNGLYAGHPTLAPPTGAFNRFELTSLDPVCIKLSRCCNPLPMDRGIVGLMSERGLSVHRQECPRLRELGLRREDLVELRWRQKDSVVEKPQKVLVLHVGRERFFQTLGRVPAEMAVQNIAVKNGNGEIDAEIVFTVGTLHGLRKVLSFFEREHIEHQFSFDQ